MNGWWNRLTRSTARAAAASPDCCAGALGTEDIEGVGAQRAAPACGGWFESSWDLRNGLAVVEEPAEGAVWEIVEGDSTRR